MKQSLGPAALAFPLPACLIGTYDAAGRPNIMTAAWTGIVCSEPPLLAVGINTGRLTNEAIKRNKAFTVSYPSSKMAVKVDFAGLVSGRDQDKFAKAGLTAGTSPLVAAPYVEECPVVSLCRLTQLLELGSHTLFIGEILDVLAEEGLKSPAGGLDMAKVDPLVFNAGGQYHKAGEPLGKAFSIGLALK
ncbi:MAG: flavin reductase family protein [Deltaproteobacteria bacterium]|jgi:flavin reductase (DIM6/NTAB) family NADH-FMN oxidoreductase RutF|nr:flavin reductase family protein [Deltaproteobacteria bacterium]